MDLRFSAPPIAQQFQDDRGESVKIPLKIFSQPILLHVRSFTGENLAAKIFCDKGFTQCKSEAAVYVRG